MRWPAPREITSDSVELCEGSSLPNGLVVRTSSRRLCRSSPCFCPYPSCHLCPWNPCPCFCSCFASSPSRGDQIFRTCGTSCRRAAAARLSPSVLCSSHWLHDASDKFPTLPPSHARHPQALDERGPTSGISLKSATSASRALCPSLGSGQSLHVSHLRSSLPRLARIVPALIRLELREHVSREVELEQAQELPCCSRPDVWVVPFNAWSPSADPPFTT